MAGVKDTDVHIEYFWNSMESFSQVNKVFSIIQMFISNKTSNLLRHTSVCRVRFQDQLRKFVKFACNQERLPSRCTCQDGNPHTADVHVPPYPMKIGPPDGRGKS